MSNIWFNPKNKKGGTNYGKVWDKEWAIHQIASQNYNCSECHALIKKDDIYISDHFVKMVFNRYKPNPKPFKKFWKNKICLKCWKIKT